MENWYLEANIQILGVLTAYEICFQALLVDISIDIQVNRETDRYR